MRYDQLGRTDLFVHPLALGTMQFGWSIDEDASGAVLDAYAEAGGNLIDTADIYSNWASRMGGPVNPGGVSEEIIGRWMARRGNRDELVVATKVRGPMGVEGREGRGSRHQREGLGRRWITRACEDSLRRLGVDHIDLYQVHYADPLVPIEETLSALDDLVRRGLVRYLGCSNFSGWRLVESLWAADRRGLERFSTVQPEYSLLHPVRGDVERDLAEVCQRFDIAMIPYSPLGGGLLTGKYRRDQPLPDSVRADEHASRRLGEENWRVIDCLLAVADRVGATPAQTAIAWMRSKPWVAAPIIGANTPAQLNDTMAALDVELTPEDLAELDAASSFHIGRADAGE